jgi:hypothetical protein
MQESPRAAQQDMCGRTCSPSTPRPRPPVGSRSPRCAWRPAQTSARGARSAGVAERQEGHRQGSRRYQEIRAPQYSSCQHLLARLNKMLGFRQE